MDLEIILAFFMGFDQNPEKMVPLLLLASSLGACGLVTTNCLSFFCRTLIHKASHRNIFQGGQPKKYFFF